MRLMRVGTITAIACHARVRQIASDVRYPLGDTPFVLVAAVAGLGVILHRGRIGTRSAAALP